MGSRRAPSTSLLLSIALCVAGGFGCGSCEDAATDQLERGAELAEGATEIIDRAAAALPDRPPGEEAEAAPPPPPRTGNRARLLINGESSFLERMALIDGAEQSIYIQALIFKADTAGGAIADRLIAKKRENPEIDIRVIVDAYANIQDYDAQMLYFELKDAGIAVHGYEPLFLEWINEIDIEDWTAGNKRYHEKYFVVDGERAVVGGMNIGDEYARIGDDPALIWRDQDIYLEGPVVADVHAAFEENFAYFQGIHDRRPGLLESDNYWQAWRHVHPRLREAVTDSVGRDRSWRSTPRGSFDADALRRRRVPSELHDDVRVSFIRSRPRLGERWIDDAYRGQIEGAQSSVVIFNAYFIPTDALRRALVEAAGRGVAVTIVTNSKATNDIPMINDAGRLAYEALIEAGVAVYEWHAERRDAGTLHAKFAVFDAERAIIGSYNLDPRSLALNSEDVVLVEDADIAGELHRHAMEHDLELAERVTAAQAEAWSDPSLLPPLSAVPEVPWWDPRFDADRFELFLIGQAGKML